MIYIIISLHFIVTFTLYKNIIRYIKSSNSFLKTFLQCFIIFLNGFSTLSIYFLTGLSLTLIYVLIFSIVVIPIFVTDVFYYYISTKYLGTLFILFIILKIFLPIVSWQSSILGMGIAILGIQIIRTLSRGGMGSGDRNLFALIGFIFGFKIVLMSFVFSIITATFASSYYFFNRKIQTPQYIPFGPYILIATLVSLSYGEILFQLYLQLYQ